MDTAMTKLIKAYNERTNMQDFYVYFNQMMFVLLEEEKKNIVDAYNEGRISFSLENGGGEFDDDVIKTFTSANDYYTQTFKK